MSLMLNRTTAPMVLRFFTLCFKQGVIDAYDFGNDLDAKEFYEQKSSEWSFGILGQPDDVDWKAFCYHMYWVARRNGMRTLAESYFFRIRGRNYLWCVLPFCMRFYLMGVKEWLDYPNPAAIEVFKSEQRVHWNKNEPIRNITKPDVFSYLHNFEFEYNRLPDEEKQVSSESMSSFVKALFDLSRKFVIKEDTDDENI